MNSSCQKCKNCKIVKTDTETNIILSEGVEEEYCNEDLQATENEQPEYFGVEKNEWICE
jgi:hypothetical protein